MTIQTTHTITLSFSVDHKGHPMATIYDKSDPNWNAREDFIEWLSKYGANKGSGAGAILDATTNPVPKSNKNWKEPIETTLTKFDSSAHAGGA